MATELQILYEGSGTVFICIPVSDLSILKRKALIRKLKKLLKEPI